MRSGQRQLDLPTPAETSRAALAQFVMRLRIDSAFSYWRGHRMENDATLEALLLEQSDQRSSSKKNAFFTFFARSYGGWAGFTCVQRFRLWSGDGTKSRSPTQAGPRLSTTHYWAQGLHWAQGLAKYRLGPRSWIVHHHSL
jgi:hypothetical protein